MTERLDGMYSSLITQALRKQDRYRTSNLIVDYRVADDLFTHNGVANKIISAPAEDAISSGFVIKTVEEEAEANKKIESILEELNFEQKFSSALSWDRLYGGAAVLIMANDGGSLEDPLDLERIKNIESLEVYSPEDIYYTSDYAYGDITDVNYGKPQFYTVTGFYGNSFLVHESRLLLFHGATVSNYYRRMRNGWGGTVFEQIQNDILNYKEGLRLSLAALSRLSQGVLKLNGMKELMMTEDGDRLLQERMQLIDLYRHLENTIALGSEDEYEIKNLSLGGIKDIIEIFQSALCSATSIPATVLFGRSPAGMSATGQSDMENYYNMVRRIQKRTLKPNLMKLISIMAEASDYEINLPDEWNIEFKPLWNASEKEQAEVDKLKAEAKKQKADTANIYMSMGALDATEVRNTLKLCSDYEIDDSLDKLLLQPSNVGGE